MSGHFQPALVRFCDLRTKLGAGDVHVRLEGSRAGFRPEVHHSTRVVHARELMHLIESEPGAFQIWSGGINPGTWFLSRVDGALDSDLAEAVHVPAGSHRRHAARQIQSGEALGQVSINAGPSRIEEVF